MKKYNLGCGNNKLEGFINVDQQEIYNPDLVMNLDKFPWNIESNSSDVVVLNHVLEHLTDLMSVMKELYRISVPDAKIYITVPHPLSYDFIVDPTHVTRITPETLNMFSKKFCKYVIDNKFSNSTLALICDVDFEISSVDYVFDEQTKNFLISKKLIPENIYENIENISYDRIFNNLITEIRMCLIVKKNFKYIQ
jgi:SAM-dependent methyltransferase